MMISTALMEEEAELLTEEEEEEEEGALVPSLVHCAVAVTRYWF